MSDPYYGEIRIWANTYNPRGWAYCDGTLLSASNNQALYAVIGISFGGTFNVSFNLPNLMCIAPMGSGTGPGLDTRIYAKRYGLDKIALTEAQLPIHNHILYGLKERAKKTIPDATMYLAIGFNNTTQKTAYTYRDGTKTGDFAEMNLSALAPVGSDDTHPNMQPYIAINYCIAIEGVFPVPS